MPNYDMPQWATIRGPFQLPSSDLNQALAEFEARTTTPRNPLLDNPETVAAELLSPFNIGLAAGMKAVAPEKPPQSRNVGGTLLERDDMTGQWEVKFQPSPKPKGLDMALKSEIKQLEDSLRENRKALVKEEDQVRRGEIARSIREGQSRLERLFERASAQSLPEPEFPTAFGLQQTVQYPRTRAEADSLSMFGRPGERTPFAFVGGAEETPIPPPASRIRILNVRRR